MLKRTEVGRKGVFAFLEDLNTFSHHILPWFPSFPKHIAISHQSRAVQAHFRI